MCRTLLKAKGQSICRVKVVVGAAIAKQPRCDSSQTTPTFQADISCIENRLHAKLQFKNVFEGPSALKLEMQNSTNPANTLWLF